MFDNDDAARHALRTLTSEPAPPVATTLDQVVRRGKRRVFIQRAGSVAGVVAVVAAIGAGTILLRPGDQGDGVQVGTSNSATAPTYPTSPMPGWEVVDMPAYAERGGKSCTNNETQVPPTGNVPFLPLAAVQSALTIAVKQALGAVPAATFPSWSGSSTRFLVVEVPMDNGMGQLQLEATRYGGSPTRAADADRVAYGNCEAPLRRTLADGTVLQLYPKYDYHPKWPSQPLAIYQPNGRKYVITSAGYSEADMMPGKDSTSKTIVNGRGKLPTTQEQLAELAEAFAGGLG